MINLNQGPTKMYSNDTRIAISVRQMIKYVYFFLFFRDFDLQLIKTMD